MIYKAQKEKIRKSEVHANKINISMDQKQHINSDSSHRPDGPAGGARRSLALAKRQGLRTLVTGRGWHRTRGGKSAAGVGPAG